MLTIRQKQILTVLDSQRDSYVRGIQLTHQLDCSLKTLQTEIKELKQILVDYKMEIKSVTSKGYSLIIYDLHLYEEFKKKVIEGEEIEDFNNQSYRITYILTQLLLSDDYVKSDNLADEMYISRSSISGDIKIVRKVLQKYNLDIDHKPNYGMKVLGLEKDKRECIAKERLGLHEQKNGIKKEWIATVSDIVVENLMKAKYRISDVVLQNLVLHICVFIERMQNHIYVENPEHFQSHGHERIIARHILEQLSEIYNFEVDSNEIEFLALHLLGKRSYEENDVISIETDQFVNDMLDFIKEKTNIDFYGDVELKISLALHLIPLFVRLESKMQLENIMVQDIQFNYPLAYDVGVIASSYIHEEKGFELSEDEIGYLAVHFSLALSKKEKKINPKRVLIICNARRGDYLMIQHTFLKEFNEMISELKIVNAYELLNCDLEEYDCIFTTFLNHPAIPSRAIRINFFMDQKDLHRIKNSLTGENESGELLKYFKEEYFMGVINEQTQEDVIYRMCQLASEYNQFDEDLYQACLRRENLGSTAYGHFIALPHPDSLISQKTVVITAILNKPILWSEQRAQLIFLICVEKGNQKDLTILFECISKFMMDDSSVQEVIRKSDYFTFTKKLGQLLG